MRKSCCVSRHPIAINFVDWFIRGSAGLVHVLLRVPSSLCLNLQHVSN